MRLSIVYFFFSSRRRHTRFDCDWSSDVCSSDLSVVPGQTPVDIKVSASIHGNGSVDAAYSLQKDSVRQQDRKSTRLNSSHSQISYAVFCLKKKTTQSFSP